LVIIGRNPILEMLRHAPGVIKKITLREGAGDRKVQEIIRTANRCNIKVEWLPRFQFAALFDNKEKSEGVSQGVLAHVEAFKYASLNEILGALREKEYVTFVILDEVQDPHNLGAIIRTSAAAEAHGVIISKKNSAKVTHTVIKSSSGAVNYIPVMQAENIYKCISRLKSEGFTIVGTTLNSKTLFSQFSFPPRCAVILGNEGRGLRKNITKICDELIKIPVARKIESLNVSVAAGVILYEIRRNRLLNAL